MGVDEASPELLGKSLSKFSYKCSTSDISQILPLTSCPFPRLCNFRSRTNFAKMSRNSRPLLQKWEFIQGCFPFRCLRDSQSGKGQKSPATSSGALIARHCDMQNIRSARILWQLCHGLLTQLDRVRPNNFGISCQWQRSQPLQSDLQEEDQKNEVSQRRHDEAAWA